MINKNNRNSTFSDCLKLKKRGIIKGVFTNCDMPKGAIIIFMKGNIQNNRDKYSIQINENLHIGKSGLIDDEICHSCDADAKIEFSDLSIRAKREIKAGEEITINYCASEEVSANPFNCKCGSKSCYGFMNGYKNLTPAQREAIKEDLSPFLIKKYH